ncbi:MAG: hypothetical protein D5R97_01380 [Candidatus Syntrophonatronum acetioxidans]|uniref:MerR family transcriptional regulator n=1 Tax=Candidatus Syntrophonatronum acetioxidans TaxID=1795816 RepID=A0A424YI24_9FIRM|nr:MAG: hypothetical protein D5R97_01380 [Candidatus Syntrophonatronum acetioxidans]
MEYLPLEEIAKKAGLKDEMAAEYLRDYEEFVNFQKSGDLILYSSDLIKLLERVDKLKEDDLTADQVKEIIKKEFFMEDTKNKENSSPWWERIFRNFRSCSGD